MGPVTRSLVFLNVGIFLLLGAYTEMLVAHFALWPVGRFAIPGLDTLVGFHLWQLVTSAFLHANVFHLLLNMFALYMLGRDVEYELGSWRYLLLYAAAVLTAALVQLFVVSMNVTDPHPTVGASGGVFGVLLAFGMLFPRRKLMLLFPPIPMPAWLFVLLYGVIELTSGVLGTTASIAHFAHLGGMLGGYLMLRHWRNRVG